MYLAMRLVIYLPSNVRHCETTTREMRVYVWEKNTELWPTVATKNSHVCFFVVRLVLYSLFGRWGLSILQVTCIFSRKSHVFWQIIKLPKVNNKWYSEYTWRNSTQYEFFMWCRIMCLCWIETYTCNQLSNMCLCLHYYVFLCLALWSVCCVSCLHQSVLLFLQ